MMHSNSTGWKIIRDTTYFIKPSENFILILNNRMPQEHSRASQVSRRKNQKQLPASVLNFLQERALRK